MAVKTYFLAVVILALRQGVAGQAPCLQSVIASALNQTASLAEGPQAAAQSASQQLQSVAHSLILSGETVFNTSQGLLQEASNRLQEEIEKAWGDLPRCVEGQRDAAAQLVFNAGAGVVRCVTDELAEVGKLVADVATQVGKAVVLPHQAAAAITACLQYPLTAVFCVAEAVGRWAEASLSITNTLVADARKGEELFVSGPQDIATCAAAKVDTALAGVNRIIVKIAQCVVDSSSTTTTKRP